MFVHYGINSKKIKAQLFSHIAAFIKGPRGTMNTEALISGSQLDSRKSSYVCCILGRKTQFKKVKSQIRFIHAIIILHFADVMGVNSLATDDEARKVTGFCV